MITHITPIVNQRPDALTPAVAEWFASATAEWPEDKRASFLARLGWAPASRLSLREVGIRLGVSGEAVRRVEAELRHRLRNPPKPVKQVVTDCWKAIGEPPRRWTVVQAELISAGLVSSWLDPVGLLTLGSLVGVQPRLQHSAGYLVREGEEPPPIDELIKVARGRSRSAGVCSLTWLVGRAAASRWNRRDLLAELESAGLKEVEPGWITDPNSPHGRDRLANLVRRMLAACGPLSVEEIEGGLEKQVRFGRLPDVPPAGVISSYLKQHADFDFDGETVHPRIDLDPNHELGLTERTLRDALWRSGAGLKRAELWRIARTAGIDLATFNTILSYSPIIDKDSSGRWKLRGNRQAPSVDESLVRGVAARPIRFTWDASGLLVLAATLVSTDTSFLDVPQAVLPFLEGREFPAMDPQRSRVGMLRIRHGRAWGFASYLSTQKLQKNDVMELAFDLSAATCRLSILGKSESPKQA